MTAYPDDVLYPISWDQAGAKAQLRVFLDIAEMQAKGTPSQDLKRIIQQRYTTHVYKAPERAGVSYMLSPILRTYSNPEVDGTLATTNIPHVMHYAPNVSNEDVGGAFRRRVMQHIQHGRWPPACSVRDCLARMVTFRCSAWPKRRRPSKEYEAMLSQFCKITDVWCLPK